jgi:hypothetical protein
MISLSSQSFSIISRSTEKDKVKNKNNKNISNSIRTNFFILRTISCIENLSNEIFYEIFDYLDGYDIYKAFYNLNIHLKNLVINSSLSMKIEISFKTIFLNHYKQFLNSNKHHIISLDFDGQFSLDEFMEMFTIDLLFTRLESLVINRISTYKLPILLFYLKYLPHLSSLSICLIDYSYDIGNIYQMIFHLPLKYFRVALPGYSRLRITVKTPLVNTSCLNTCSGPPDQFLLQMHLYIVNTSKL